MKYTIQNNNLIEFSEINIGELFIADDIPFIKVPEIRMNTAMIFIIV